MLATHLNNTESLLLAQSEIPSIGGHALHKGTPREVFVAEFLRDHLASDLAIGSGELIDSTSQPNTPRAQHDIILYKRSYPRIYLGGEIGAYLIESAVATVEIKSLLDQAGVDQAVAAAAEAKELEPSTTGGLRRGIGNYIVAYRGAANMATVFGWIRNAYAARNLSDPHFSPVGERKWTNSPALNGVFVLGRGFCLFENDVGYLQNTAFYEHQTATWSIGDCSRGSLALFFAALLGLTAKNAPAELNPWPYFNSLQPASVTFDRIDSIVSNVTADNTAPPS